MPSQELAPAVRAFVTEHLHSVEDLYLLVLLAQDPGRWWDAAAVAREIGTSEPSARRALDHFATRNLLDIRITGDVRYQFAPGVEPLRIAALATVETFRRTPAHVLQLLTGSARRSLRDFSDAFRIRRDDSS